jgi:mono/diheme cytochrome c family protein
MILKILAGVPASSARPQYLASLGEVYGDGSCGTCHIKASGGGPRNDYGTTFEIQPNHVVDPSAALLLIGKPPGLTVATSGATATTVATTAASQVTPAPSESVVGTETPAVTSVTARGTPTAAGFEFAFSHWQDC